MNARFLSLILAGAALAMPRTNLAHAQPARAEASPLVSFTFQQAPIEDVLGFLGEAAKKPVYKSPAAQFSVTVRSRRRISVREAIRLMQTVASLHGYALVETDDALILVTTREAILRGLGRTGVSGARTQAPSEDKG